MKSVPRLYESFLPKHYDITLTIDREQRLFHGNVILTGTKTKEQHITLHAKGLTVHSAKVDGKIVHTSPADFDGLVLHDESDHGEKTLEYSFTGHITDTMHGLYPCYYEHNGEKKELLVTQFESHHAREVFPCIDEPEAKATFKLTVETEKDVHVLSNTPVHSRDYTENTTITVFEDTPRMSTYLLAFVTGDLHRVHSTSKNGTEVSVYAVTSHDKKSLEFSLDIAVRGIDFFEEYFGIPYPLAKSDHVAVPDFSAGAMENWGLITYRERVLIVADGTPQSSKELVASVICHELSHQWFGNLVTMKWWNDLWLNESFANMMEYVAVDALEPTWKIWQHFASHETAAALNRDHIAGVQPVKTPVHHPDEITTLFDPAIVYAKGSRLLRMLQTYVGETAFQKGLHHYFKTHAYSNTSSDDLWRSLNTQTSKDIAGFMTPWLSQSGFPLVTIQATEQGYTLSQKRLIIGGHDETQLWPIPLASTNSHLPDIFSTKRAHVTSEHSFSLLNLGNNAHFIADYDNDTMTEILTALDDGKLSSVDRLALLFESVILMKCGHKKPEELLELLQHYSNETEESVWTVIAFALGELHRYVELTEHQSALEAFAVTLARPLYDQLHLSAAAEDTEATRKLRTILYQLMLYGNHQDTIDTLLTLARENTLESVQGDLRNVVYSAVAQFGTRSEFAELVALHNSVGDPQIRQDALDALTTTKDKDHIALLLHQLTNKNHVKPQDMLRWYVGLMRNSDARDDTWEWMIRSWKHIKITFSGDKMYESFPRYTAASMNSRQAYKSYREFFDPQMSDPALTRIIEIGRHELDFRSTLIEKQAKDFIASLVDISSSQIQK